MELHLRQESSFGRADPIKRFFKYNMYTGILGKGAVRGCKYPELRNTFTAIGKLNQYCHNK